ncbi:hypothetical protein HID58_072624 [Brassica napus]|uniref:Uncharacterized protein n=1 Tax=Brassica napus TaxID=3708 RepID=A0ABQ7Z4Y2_BRANA|nr:hypothetical protein HID58_072624 [Brassica napus]
MSFGHVLPSSPSKVHVSRGQRVTTASHRRRRSDHRITRPNRSSKLPRHGDKRPAAMDLWEPPSPRDIIPNTKPPRRYSRTRTVPVDGGPELGQTETGRDGEKTET